MPLQKYQPYKQHKSRLIVPISLLAMVVISALSVTALNANDQVPHEVGGFSLGSDINEYPEVVASNFLQETVVTDRYGFRKGIISTGVCKYPDKILKMRLKYEDSDKKFFQKLLKEYKKKYGAPHEWKGDSFGIVHIWKWHFTDSENRKVSLSLQHNLKNINENIGNLVKLSYPELVEEERACFNQMCEEKKKDQDVKKREELKQPDWDYMIPK
ncbi:hypothetical protein [Desulfopila sp. IMCC35008]|uniref:hypothetical protein n=1 Tax=Desulfopila sp. IMCC35008 TaxID=2653858 RepID=UPI0013D36821|nr:hypothetical protein [Desulfopila sp. IMCC35008]